MLVAKVVEGMINANLANDQRISVQPSSEGKTWFSAELIRDGESVKDIFISDYATIPVMEMARICADIAEGLKGKRKDVSPMMSWCLDNIDEWPEIDSISSELTKKIMDTPLRLDADENGDVRVVACWHGFGGMASEVITKEKWEPMK